MVQKSNSPRLKSVRWGILGTANVVRRIAPAIQTSESGILIAVASRQLERAKAVAAQYGAPFAFDSYGTLLESEGIDAVYIPLPNALHHEWTLRAASAGKHVLCEKPLGLTSRQCQEMQSASETHRVLLMEALSYRFHPQIARCKELIASGILGKLRGVRSGFSFPVPNSSDIRFQPALGGGVLLDAGCYCVDVSRTISGSEPYEAFAFANFGPATSVDEALVGVLRFPDGVVASFDCSFRSQYRQFVEIIGTEGSIELARPFSPRIEPTAVLVRHGDAVESFDFEGADQYVLMIESFNRAVLGRSALQIHCQDSVRNLRAIDALYDSAREGRAVAVPTVNAEPKDNRCL
jgi:xylose dehydrogenase (NAD/NADP)